MATTTGRTTLIPVRPLTTIGPVDGSGNFLSPIYLDCAITQTHALENEITDHPVEQGSDISDHIRPKPVRITIVGIVTDTPLKIGAQTLGATAPSLSPISAVAYARLLELRVGQLLSVVTRRGQFDSMAIESISIPDDKSTAASLNFTITLKKIRIVQNRTTRVVVAKKKSAHAKVTTGKQAPTAKDWSNTSSAALNIQESGTTGPTAAAALVGTITGG